MIWLSNRHIWAGIQDELVAYASSESDNESDPVVIGRVIVSDARRGAKLGQQLIGENAGILWAALGVAIYLGAQAHICNMRGFGFIPVTDVL